MQTFAEIDLNIMVLMFSRGKAKQSVAQLTKALDKIERWLRNSKTGFFGFQIPTNTSRSSPHEQYDWDDNHNAGSLQQQKAPYYSMVDLHAFPSVCRIFYLQGTTMDPLYQHFFAKSPAVQRWINKMLAQPIFNDGKAFAPRKAFKNWVEELVSAPAGTKPGFRLPVKL